MTIVTHKPHCYDTVKTVQPVLQRQVHYIFPIGHLNVCPNARYNHVWWSKNSDNLEEGTATNYKPDAYVEGKT